MPGRPIASDTTPRSDFFALAGHPVRWSLLSELARSDCQVDELVAAAYVAASEKAWAIAVEMELHAAIGSTTKAKAEAIEGAILSGTPDNARAALTSYGERMRAEGAREAQAKIARIGAPGERSSMHMQASKLSRRHALQRQKLPVEIRQIAIASDLCRRGDTQLSYQAGAAISENLQRFIAFHFISSMAWDIPRAVLTSVLIVITGPAVLSALRRTQLKASFLTPVQFIERLK